MTDGNERRIAHEIELSQLSMAQSMLDDVFDNLAKEVKMVNPMQPSISSAANYVSRRTSP